MKFSILRLRDLTGENNDKQGSDDNVVISRHIQNSAPVGLVKRIVCAK